MKFYLDTAVAGNGKSLQILKDYAYWFKKIDKVSLTLFTSAGHPAGLYDKFCKLLTGKESPSATFIKQSIVPNKLHQFYSKKVLLNEWTPYHPGDIFRLFKIMNPLKESNGNDTDFDIQPVSIQYDIRYDRHMRDDYKGYNSHQLSAVASAVHYFRPEKVLDGGCGAGAHYHYLKEVLKGCKPQYHGIDKSRYQLIKAIDLYAGPDATFEIGDLQKTRFSENHFDFSFSESTLPFIPNPLKALKEMERISTEGFFASLYTLEDFPELYLPFVDGSILSLNTGATWKYYDSITPNTYYLPLYESIKALSEKLQKTVMITNNDDQYFEPLGLKTVNCFFYPRSWYRKNKTTFANWNYRPLM